MCEGEWVEEAVDIYVPMPPRKSYKIRIISEEHYKRIMKKLERFKRMEEDNYVRVLGILHRDMFDILDKQMRTEENKDKDPLVTLQNMAKDIIEAEIKLNIKLNKVTFDKEKKKFDMNFK